MEEKRRVKDRFSKEKRDAKKYGPHFNKLTEIVGDRKTAKKLVEEMSVGDPLRSFTKKDKKHESVKTLVELNKKLGIDLLKEKETAKYLISKPEDITFLHEKVKPNERKMLIKAMVERKKSAEETIELRENVKKVMKKHDVKEEDAWILLDRFSEERWKELIPVMKKEEVDPYQADNILRREWAAKYFEKKKEERKNKE